MRGAAPRLQPAIAVLPQDEVSADHVGRGAHLLAALRDTRNTTLEWLTTARNYARYANEGGLYDDVLAFLEKHGR